MMKAMHNPANQGPQDQNSDGVLAALLGFDFNSGVRRMTRLPCTEAACAVDLSFAK